MNVWYERSVLVVAILGVIPVLLLAAAFGPLALLAIPAEAVAAIFLYRRLREARLSPRPIDATPRPDRRPPVAPVDDEAIAALPEPVTACPDCAFVGVRMPQLGDGLWPGGGELGSRIVCPRCGYQGVAVSFEKREEYGAFLKHLSAGDAASSP